MPFKFTADLGWLTVDADTDDAQDFIATTKALDELAFTPDGERIKKSVDEIFGESWAWESLIDALSSKIEAYVEGVLDDHLEGYKSARVNMTSKSVAEVAHDIEEAAAHPRIDQTELSAQLEPLKVAISELKSRTADLAHLEDDGLTAPIRKKVESEFAELNDKIRMIEAHIAELLESRKPKLSDVLTGYTDPLLGKQYSMTPVEPAFGPFMGMSPEAKAKLSIHAGKPCGPEPVDEQTRQRREMQVEAFANLPDDHDDHIDDLDCFAELQTLFRATKMSTADFAEATGFKYQKMYQWLRGNNRASLMDDMPHIREFCGAYTPVEESFACPVCAREFASKAALTGHQSASSACRPVPPVSEALYCCPHCDKSFPSEPGLVTHMAMKHQDEFQAMRAKKTVNEEERPDPDDFPEKKVEPFRADWVNVVNMLSYKARGYSFAEVSARANADDGHSEFDKHQARVVCQWFGEELSRLEIAHASSPFQFNEAKVGVQKSVQKQAKDGKVRFGE